MLDIFERIHDDPITFLNHVIAVLGGITILLVLLAAA